MGSDNISTQPKRRRSWRGFLSSSLLLVGSFCLPFIFLLLITSRRELPHSHVRDPSGHRSPARSRKAGRPLSHTAHQDALPLGFGEDGELSGIPQAS
eukprot:scaffold72117_cov30-Prasinocladus_malaysianus.AAC.1